MATMNFSGILSRKAGMKASSNRVSNPVFTTKDGDIAGRNPDGSVTIIATQRVIDADEAATLSRAARASAASRKRNAEADAMRAAAQEAEVLNAEATANPEAAPAPKKEAAPYQVKSTAKRRATVKATATKKATANREEAPTPAQAAPAQAAPTPKEAAPVAPAPTTPKKATTKKAATKQEAAPAKKSNLRLMMYSPKSLALFGDTKPIKEELKKIGGKYNPNLHPLSPDQSVPGWIFPLKAKEDLEALIANL